MSCGKIYFALLIVVDEINGNVELVYVFFIRISTHVRCFPLKIILFCVLVIFLRVNEYQLGG